MLKYDYALLGVLAAVVQERSFKRAAERLNISQSAVSQRIKTLEARLGASLLMRGSNQETLPTEKGKMLYAHVETLHLAEADLERRMGNSDSPLKLRISTNHDTLATWFPEVLNRARHELNVAFEIIPDDERYTAGKLTSGEAQAALTSQADPQHGFRRERLGAMRYVGVASPAFVREFFTGGVTKDSLRQAPAILFDQKNTISRDWAYTGFGLDDLYPAHWVPSFAGYLRACLNGVGWGIMPDFHIETELSSGQLILLKPGHTCNVPLFWHHSTVKTEIMSGVSKIVKDVSHRYLAQI